MRWSRASVALASLLTWGVTLVEAQVVKPLTGGVFGMSETREARQRLDVMFSLIESYDTDTPPEIRDTAPAHLLVGGRSTMVAGRTEYGWEGSRARVGTTAEGIFRRYNELEPGDVFSYSAGVGFSARLGRRTTLQANESFAYAPSNLYGLFPSIGDASPGDTIPTAPNYDVTDQESYSHDATVTVTHGLTRRSRLSVAGSYQHTDFVNETDVQKDLESRGAHAAFEHDVGRNTTLSLGYRYRTGTFGYAATGVTLPGGASEHGVDIRVRASRALSATRRMSVGVELSPSTVDLPAVTGSGNGSSRLYRMSGGGSFNWHFRRSWQTRAAVSRGLEYVPDLTEPVFATGYTAEIVGLFHPRLEFLAGVRRSSGASALDRDALTFDTSSVVVRLRQALTRKLAIDAEYIYYFYDFRSTRQLPTGFPLALERNGVRAGLTLAVPALRK